MEIRPKGAVARLAAADKPGYLPDTATRRTELAGNKAHCPRAAGRNLAAEAADKNFVLRDIDYTAAAPADTGNFAGDTDLDIALLPEA